MKNQAGFTLIEMVAVIVLLGVLAVTALPRFLDLQGDARRGIVGGLEAAIRGVNTQVYAKALMAGVETAPTATVTFSGARSGGTDLIAIAYGYPTAAAIYELLDIQGDGNQIVATTPGATDTTVNIGYDRSAPTGPTDDNCYLVYTQATATATPQVDTTTNVGDC